MRGQAQSVRPGGACDKGAVDRGTSRWLAPVDGVVYPSAALLHAHAAPLRLSQQPPLGCILGNVLGQDDMTARGGAERQRERVRQRAAYPQSMHQTPERGRGPERQMLHRYSNSSSKYFSEYSISWAVMVLRARGKLVRALHGSRERARHVRAGSGPRTSCTVMKNPCHVFRYLSGTVLSLT